MEFEPVIGLEVHVQLSTESKLFCGSSARFGAEPNEFTDPVTLGLPGALPVLNRRVVEFAMVMGLATKCEIRQHNRFARKHYFYPDLPKGYQISQFEEPICERGHLTVRFPSERADAKKGEASTRTIGIKRIHMEEDAGKNLHDSRSNSSLVDLNRAGVALLEVVSEPDLRSPAEAGAYLRTVRQLVRFLGISDGNMEEGSLRCDANISLRPVGSLKFGTRAEIKNINSFKFVESALEYEIARQAALLNAGKEVVQETLLYDSATNTTRAMRTKEESSDYRYFPDPDLPPLQIQESWIRELERRMPKLPQEWQRELVEGHGLTDYDAGVLTAEKVFVDYFESVLKVCGNAKAACNWITTELFGLLHKHAKDIRETPVSASNLGELIKLVDVETINGKMAKAVFEEMFATGKSPQELVDQKGLKQITNEQEIEALVRMVFEKNESSMKDYVGGNDRLHGHFVGEVMRASGGAANPKKVNEIIKREIARLRAKQ